jgi:hypothetical protein
MGAAQYQASSSGPAAGAAAVIRPSSVAIAAAARVTVSSCDARAPPLLRPTSSGSASLASARLGYSMPSTGMPVSRPCEKVNVSSGRRALRASGLLTGDASSMQIICRSASYDSTHVSIFGTTTQDPNTRRLVSPRNTGSAYAPAGS